VLAAHMYACILVRSPRPPVPTDPPAGECSPCVCCPRPCPWQLLRAREENGALQRRQEEQSNHLRAQLEGQKREFEETKKRLVPPREFEMLRVRLIEELEVPYRNRFEQLQQELELSRGQFYAQRRESGLMREEFEATAALHVKEIQALQDEYELKLGECQGRLRTMQALVEDTTDKERVAALHRENLTLRANAKVCLAD
jgi:hypothetical protein